MSTVHVSDTKTKLIDVSLFHRFPLSIDHDCGNRRMSRCTSASSLPSVVSSMSWSDDGGNVEEGILGVGELAGDRVVELRVVDELRVVGLKTCEWEGDVVAVVAPLGGVAQVVSHGVKVVGVHGEEGKEKDEEVRVEVNGEVEELREKRSPWMA